jgi:outer membrane lipoprotein-sorting protein
MGSRAARLTWGTSILVALLGGSGACVDDQEAAPPSYEQFSKSMMSAETLMYDFSAVSVNTRSDGKEERAEVSGSARFKAPGLARVIFKIKAPGAAEAQEITLLANKDRAFLIMDGQGTEQKTKGSLPGDLRSCIVLAGPSFWWMMLGMSPGGDVPLEGPKPLAEFLRVEHASSSRLPSGEGRIQYDLAAVEGFSATLVVRTVGKEPWLPVERELTMTFGGRKSSIKETYRHVAVGEKIADEVFRFPGK